MPPRGALPARGGALASAGTNARATGAHAARGGELSGAPKPAPRGANLGEVPLTSRPGRAGGRSPLASWGPQRVALRRLSCATRRMTLVVVGNRAADTVAVRARDVPQT